MKVTLVPGSYPLDPVKAIWLIWEQSRCDDDMGTMLVRYERLIRGDNRPESDFPTGNEHPDLRFRNLLQMGVPIFQFIHFTFLLEDMHVSFREQLVRHKVGTKVGPQISFDDIPDLSTSTFWSQTSRVRDLQNFADNGQFYVPEFTNEDIVDIQVEKDAPDVPAGLTDREVYGKVMNAIQWGYRELRARGYKPEVARELIPVAMTHRMAWHVNGMTLKNVCKDRSCWIAQAHYWHPVIRGVVKELVQLSHAFYALTTPPCISTKTECFSSCPFSHENERRMPGKNDPGIPCTVWAYHNLNVQSNNQNKLVSNDKEMEILQSMRNDFRSLWGRDVFTGARL